MRRGPFVVPSSLAVLNRLAYYREEVSWPGLPNSRSLNFVCFPYIIISSYCYHHHLFTYYQPDRQSGISHKCLDKRVGIYLDTSAPVRPCKCISSVILAANLLHFYFCICACSLFPRFTVFSSYITFMYANIYY